LSRFAKWHRMIYHSHLTHFKNKLEFKFHSHSRQNSRDFNICNNGELKTKNSEKKLKKEFNFELEINSPAKKRKQSMNLIDPFEINIFHENEESLKNIEEGMLLFYKKNKIKFLERVSKGPPDSFRWTSYIVSMSLPSIRLDCLFNQLIKLKTDDKTDSQIRKDLNRTLSDEPCFNLSETQTSLYRLLKAFANLDKEVAYCQGMNFIFGFVLLLSDFNELDSLYMLIGLFSTTYREFFNLRGFYLTGFPLLKLYIFIFFYHFEKRMPALRSHFLDLDIPDEIWVAKWFQTLYTINLPLNVVVRLWDCLIVYGLPFVISFTLALIKNLEDDLLKASDTIDIVEYFKIMISVDTNTLQINVEDIISQAKKINLKFDELKIQYEAENKIDLSVYDIQYNLADIIGDYSSFVGSFAFGKIF
jgi:hypothetical protein